MDESVPIIASSTSSADVDELDEDALMQRALQLSMMDAIPTSGNNVCCIIMHDLFSPSSLMFSSCVGCDT